MKVRATPMNRIERYFRLKMEAANFRRREIADKLFITPEGLEHQLRKPWRRWTLGQLVEYSEAVGGSVEDVMVVALMCMKGDAEA